MSALSWLISGLVALLLVSFGLYLLGLRALPTAERPRTRTYDRLGRLAGTAENPDYRENPGELAEMGPDSAPGGAAPPPGHEREAARVE